MKHYVNKAIGAFANWLVSKADCVPTAEEVAECIDVEHLIDVDDVIYQLVEEIDKDVIASAVADGIDVGDVAEYVDGRIDWQAFASDVADHVDLDTIAESLASAIDMDDMAERVARCLAKRAERKAESA